MAENKMHVGSSFYVEPPYCNKAGQDEIARLRSEISRLREALKPFDEFLSHFEAIPGSDADGDGDVVHAVRRSDEPHLLCKITVGDFRRARAALEPHSASLAGEEVSPAVSAASGRLTGCSCPPEGLYEGVR